MSVTAQVSQDLLWSGKRSLGDAPAQVFALGQGRAAFYFADSALPYTAQSEMLPEIFWQSLSATRWPLLLAIAHGGLVAIWLLRRPLQRDAFGHRGPVAARKHRLACTLNRLSEEPLNSVTPARPSGRRSSADGFSGREPGVVPCLMPEAKKLLHLPARDFYAPTHSSRRQGRD